MNSEDGFKIARLSIDFMALLFIQMIAEPVPFIKEIVPDLSAFNTLLEDGDTREREYLEKVVANELQKEVLFDEDPDAFIEKVDQFFHDYEMDRGILYNSIVKSVYEK